MLKISLYLWLLLHKRQYPCELVVLSCDFTAPVARASRKWQSSSLKLTTKMAVTMSLLLITVALSSYLCARRQKVKEKVNHLSLRSEHVRQQSVKATVSHQKRAQ